MTLRQVLADPLTRDGAREAAERELRRREYQEAQPPLVLRLLGRLLRAVGDLLDRLSLPAGGGGLARLLLVLVLAAVAALVLLRLGPLTRATRPPPLFDGGRTRTAAEHRADAERHAREGRWAEAVRERLRAVVRELEVRGVLDSRDGRTAGEVAADAGRAVPGLADPLTQAARVFDEVWYGGRPAGADGYALLVRVDEQVAAARLVPA